MYKYRVKYYNPGCLMTSEELVIKCEFLDIKENCYKFYNRKDEADQIVALFPIKGTIITNELY